MLVGLLALASGARRELTAAQRELLLKELKSEGLSHSFLDEVLKSRAIAIVATRKVAPTEEVKLPLQAPALDGVVFGEIQNWLKVLSKGSLYELLDLPNATPPPRLTSQAQLLFCALVESAPQDEHEHGLGEDPPGEPDLPERRRVQRPSTTGACSICGFRRLVSRIDLVLAGSTFAIDEATNLVRMGVQEFGLNEAVVEQCLAARMAASNISAREKRLRRRPDSGAGPVSPVRHMERLRS